MTTFFLAIIRLALLLTSITVLAALPACGDDGGVQSDGGMTSNFSLEVLNPPGDSIGLDFSGTSALRVRYLDDQGEALVKETVSFNLINGSNESTGGASLSATEAKTDSMGVATIDLVAGAERVNYRVEASAAQAPSVIFYIQVSDQGFVNLRITSAHVGPRDPATYEKVQLRIYANPSQSCTDTDFDNLLQSSLQPRTQDAIGEVSEFMNLAADDAYLVVAWAEIAGGRPLAQSCLSLPASRLRSGRTFSAVMSLSDRSYELGQALEIETVIDLRPLSSQLVGANAWRQLRCPFGHAELLLDCLADAQVSDALMDCDGSSTGPLSTALAPRRGVAGPDGCLLSIDSQGGTSIDALLQAALDAESTTWPSTAERAALADGYASLTDEVRIDSILSATGASTANHRLLLASLGSESSDLVASNRPVVESVGVPYQLGAAPVLGVTGHGFTLRYGDIAAEHYETLALVPANVAGLGESLGEQFMDGVSIGAESGCTALEAFVCTELSLAAPCANQCAAIAVDLNTHLSGWLPDLSATGVDYELSFAAHLSDDDNDLRVDSLSADSSLDAAEIIVRFTTDRGTELLPATLSAAALPVAP